MTPCREWRGPNVRGYGRKYDRTKKQTVLLHRWVVAQIHGWVAIDGKVVMHRCDNPACYRYDHLVVGTQSDNVADMHDKNRQADRPVECGTVSGYKHHRNHDEAACSSCKAAKAADDRNRRASRSPRLCAACGETKKIVAHEKCGACYVRARRLAVHPQATDRQGNEGSK